MAEPLLRRLAARGERLTVAALPSVAPVFEAMPQVAEIVLVPFAHGGLQWRERRRVARQMQGRFDVAYVLPNSLKSALVPWWADIPRRVGYLGEARVGLLTHRLKNPPRGARTSMVARYSALSGDRDVMGDRPQLHWSAERSASALHRWALLPHSYWVLAPGAEYGPAKRWPSAHFAQLARQIDGPVLVLGSAKEVALGDEIAAAAGPRCINLAGQTSLSDAIGLIAAARAVVSNDSGLMHVAAGLGRPQVAVFGSSSPEHTPPLNAHARVLWLKHEAGYQPPLDCAPCYERQCPLGHTRCLQDIAAAQVLAALRTLQA